VPLHLLLQADQALELRLRLAAAGAAGAPPGDDPPVADALPRGVPRQARGATKLLEWSAEGIRFMTYMGRPPASSRVARGRDGAEGASALPRRDEGQPPLLPRVARGARGLVVQLPPLLVERGPLVRRLLLQLLRRRLSTNSYMLYCPYSLRVSSVLLAVVQCYSITRDFLLR